MVVFPNAKINLGLSVTEKRPDGYHNLVSCFYPVGWSDAIEATPATEFSFHTHGISIPGNGADNLCVKAYQLLAANHQLPPVQLHLLKLVPIGAGLGGGSADASFTLRLLNDQYNLGLGTEQLHQYALQLGSDCPFFIDNKPVLVTGRGEVFSPIDISLAGKHIILVYPGLHINTGEAYRSITPGPTGYDLKAVIESNDPAQWRQHLVNDFELGLASKYPVLQQVKEQLYQAGAYYAAMTGSGSTLFGLFDAAPNPNNLPQWPAHYHTWQGQLA